MQQKRYLYEGSARGLPGGRKKKRKEKNKEMLLIMDLFSAIMYRTLQTANINRIALTLVRKLVSLESLLGDRPNIDQPAICDFGCGVGEQQDEKCLWA